MIEFTIPVNPVTKKNSMQIIPIRTKSGKERHIVVPSSQYKKYEKECKPYVECVRNAIGIIHYPVNIQCVFYMETKRKVDISNLLNSIDDILVQWGLLLDDNRDIIASHDGSRVLYDKFKPRTEIVITEVKDYVQWKDTVTKQTVLF